MGLQFIFGKSGAGKTQYIYDKVIRESVASPETNFIVIVPEQFTVQVEKDLCRLHPSRGIFNIDVLSFGRLAYRIFEETGGLSKIVLDDEGKNLILRRIAGQFENDLHVLRGNLKKQGYISEVKGVISEFKQYGIGPGQLDELLDELPKESYLSYKLQDILKVYDGFEQFLSDKYITGEDLLDILASVIPKSEYLKDTVIVMDSFTGFTPVQHKVIKELLCVCKEVAVTVLMDEREDPYVYKSPYQLFALSKQMVTGLVDLASSRNVEIKDAVFLNNYAKSRFADNEEMAFLEANLFRYSRAKYTKEQHSISIHAARSPKKEAEFVAAKIRQLVREEGLRYRQIGIIASDVSVYGTHLEKACEEYGIPLFLDHKKSILLNAFVEYIRSLLAMVEQSFSYESVFRFLRTGMTSFTMEEVDMLENYVLATGIRGYKKWQAAWKNESREMDEERLKILNGLRVRFVEELEDLVFILGKRTKTVKDITLALYEFFVKEDCQKRVADLELKFQEEGEFALAKEYSQVYRIVIDLFDKFADLLGDEKISLKDYCELLDAGLEEAKVGVIPPSLDQVIAGDVERTRFMGIRALFFVGGNDTLLPGNLGQGGLLSERDREQFIENKLSLSPGMKEKTYIQKLYLYMNLTKPTDHLFISYSKVSAEGKSLRPAYLISDIRRLYPDLSVTDEEKRGIEEQEFTLKSAVDLLIEGLQRRDTGLSEDWKEIYTWIYKETYEFKEKLLNAAFYRKETEKLTKETAKLLYGSSEKFSVTRLEQFAACAYAHFLNYGLKLSDRQQYEFEALDLGNIAHQTLERFSRKVDEANEKWTDLDDKTRNEMVDECVDESIQAYGNTVLFSTARNEYMITRIKRLMHRSVWALTEQFRQGDFTPSGYEMKFGSGKIDRIDTCEEENKIYVKVTDYKTGAKVFDITSFYHGLQLQLPIYLNAAIDIEKFRNPQKDIEPAGIFYYRIKDPIVDRVDDEEELNEKILKELKLDGLVNSDEHVIEHLEKNLTGSSIFIPVARNKNGSHSKYSKVLEPDDFKVFLAYTKQKEKELKKRITDGEAGAVPFELGGFTGCDYCPFRDICGFDPQLDGCDYQTFYKMSAEKVVEKMKEELGKEQK